MEDFKYFLNKVNERTEFQYGLRESYNDDGNKALGQNVEYFGFKMQTNSLKKGSYELRIFITDPLDGFVDLFKEDFVLTD